MRLKFTYLLAVALAALTASAQQQQSGPSLPNSPDREKQIEKAEQSRRMLGLVPQFGVTDRKDAPPLTPRGKFRLFYRTAFDPMEFVLTGMEAGVDQAENAFPDYGQGAAGYGKRFGAAFTDELSSNLFTTFVYPTLLQEDPRYFRLREGSFKRRFGYALSQVFIAHKDAGGRTFNWSNALGALSSGGLSNAYYPAADRGFELTMSRAGIALLYNSLGGIGSEFWPDLARKLHHKPQPLAPGEQTQKQ
jgi:hypothetical protein